MVERFLKQTTFSSQDDYKRNLEFIVPDNFNFAYDVMDAWAEEQPDKQAMLWTNDKGEVLSFSFADIKHQSDQAASWLTQLGIGRGDVVMLILKRRYEFWIAMLALQKIGAVAIPATHMLTAHDLVYRNNSADIKCIICAADPYVMGEIKKSMAESPTLTTLIAVGEQKENQTISLGNNEGNNDNNKEDNQNISEENLFHNWHKEIGQAPAFVRPKVKNHNTDMMLIYFTSGTSGNPKMVAHDFTYPLGHITTGLLWHNLKPHSIHITVADTGWAKAAWGKFYGQWFAGATIFIYDHEKFAAADLMKMMEKHRVTSFCAPPTVYRFMIHEDFNQYDLSSLEWACTAGEALNPSVFERFKELTGLQIMEGFGQTETTMTLGTMPWNTPKPGSMGLPNPQYDIDLVRADGTSCEDGEKGEIVISLKKGKPLGLCMCYYRDEEKNAEVFRDGFYHTGDMAWRDQDGYYWFEGRIDDVIKSSGYRIGPFEVESALISHPAVVECAITGVPDEVRGMVVKATVVLHKDWKNKADDALVKELQNHVKKETAPYKYPRIVEFVDELPKTISGKIRRVEIRENDKKK